MGMTEAEVDQEIASIKAGAIQDKIADDLKEYVKSTTGQLNLSLDTTISNLPDQVKRIKFIVEYTTDEIKLSNDQTIPAQTAFVSGCYVKLDGDEKFRTVSKIGKVGGASGGTRGTPAKSVPVPQELIDQGHKTWKSYADSLGIMKPSQSACKILESAGNEVYLKAKAEFDAASD